MTARITTRLLETSYGRETIPFTLTHEDRSRLYITVHPD